ncbi:hypothetical protein BTHE68_51270 [Burkholderia sp. THE68]|uniref:hypothetical protein n=1 Tax=Burkholderia sp. THE68 TaxID=758782 RepID=UPI001318B908|nr:hypothetical protein [Burkholderia sp. THE68]BBU31393.1 hypothetical protein BTHE68_51270 [Burkholderia sp. THE68]
MKTKKIEDGNLTSWVRLLLIVAGISLAVVAVECDVPSWAAKTLLLTGFGIGLVGGMTSRAALMKIQPFDNSYKKTRKSYEVKDEEQDKS